MNRADALEILQSLRTRLEARGIVHAGVFGSVARNAAAARSDIVDAISLIQAWAEEAGGPEKAIYQDSKAKCDRAAAPGHQRGDSARQARSSGFAPVGAEH